MPSTSTPSAGARRPRILPVPGRCDVLGSASAGIVMCGFRCLIVWLERSVLRLRRAAVVVEEWEVLAQLVDELVGVDGLAHDDETVDQ